MQEPGKLLVFAGLAIALLGAILWLAPKFRLPGDIHVQKDGFSFSFPIVTCVIVSIVLTILLNIFRR